jgi:hypothetical protein
VIVIDGSQGEGVMPVALLGDSPVARVYSRLTIVIA